MAKLKIEFAPAFSRDLKKLNRKHFDLNLLYDVVDLIAINDKESLKILRIRHNMHSLTGK